MCYYSSKGIYSYTRKHLSLRKKLQNFLNLCEGKQHKKGIGSLIFRIMNIAVHIQKNVLDHVP